MPLSRWLLNYPSPSLPRMRGRLGKGRRGRAVLSFALFAVLLVIYAFSTVRTSYDSRWSLHTAMSLLRGNGGDLTEYGPALIEHDFYALEFPGGRPHTYFPIGVSVLAAPAVAVAWLVHPALFEELQQRVPDGFEKVVASIIGAIAGVVFFWLIYGQFEERWIALAATVIFALGTPMWSTATRALWQHGPLVLMFTITMLLMVRARQRPALVQYAGLALAMAYIIRPTAAVAIVAISIYVLIWHRAYFLRYLGWAAVAAIPWIAFNYSIYGEMLPPYYAASRLTASTSFAEGLLGVMFSPSRGLLTTTPVAVFAISGFVLSLRDPQQRPLHVAYAAIVVGITGVVASWPDWSGGHGFGPRLMTDVMPFLVYFAAFNLDLPANTSARVKTWLARAVMGFGLIGILIHMQGAVRTAPALWNALPIGIEKAPERAWDWRDVQFLRTKPPAAR
jgi:dolichyl-phosphate-mannose-protein mannosyltransferase